MKHRSPAVERDLHARLAWPGVRATRLRPHAAPLRSPHAAFVAGVIDRIGRIALAQHARIEVAWSAPAMELALGSAAPERREGDGRGAAGAVTHWKVVETTIATATGANDATSHRRGRDGVETIRERWVTRVTTPPAIGADAARGVRLDVFARLERRLEALLARRFPIPRREQPLAWAPAAAGLLQRLQPPHARFAADAPPARPRALPSPATSVPQARPRALPSPATSMPQARAPFAPVPALVFREVMPAFLPRATPAGVTPQAVGAIPEPGLVDHLFASSEHPTALEGMTLRALPGTVSIAASSEQPLAPARDAGPQSLPSPALPARFSRAEVELLASRVLTLIKRRERLERESKGLL